MAKRRKPPAKARKTRARLDAKARRPPSLLPEPRYPFRTRAMIWIILTVIVVSIAYLLG